MHPHYQYQQSTWSGQWQEWLDLWGVDRVWHSEWSVWRQHNPLPDHQYWIEFSADPLCLMPQVSHRHRVLVWPGTTQQYQDTWLLDANTYMMHVKYHDDSEFESRGWRVPCGKLVDRPLRVALLNYLIHSDAPVDMTWTMQEQEHTQWHTIQQQYRRLNRRRFGLPALDHTQHTWPYRNTGRAWAWNLSGQHTESWPNASAYLCIETAQMPVDVMDSTLIWPAITEKTFRALAHGLPTVFWGCQHTIQYLHSQGYRTWGDHWSESYDDEFDVDARFRKLCQTIEEINSWSDQEWLNRWPDFQHIHRHNRENYAEHHQRSRQNAEWLLNQL